MVYIIGAATGMPASTAGSGRGMPAITVGLTTGVAGMIGTGATMLGTGAGMLGTGTGIAALAAKIAGSGAGIPARTVGSRILGVEAVTSGRGRVEGDKVLRGSGGGDAINWVGVSTRVVAGAVGGATS